jgi:hypothetical protein
MKYKKLIYIILYKINHYVMDEPQYKTKINSTLQHCTNNNKDFNLVNFMKDFDFSKNIQSTRKATLSDFNICEQTNQIDTSDQIIYKRQENYGERKRIKP